jgi:predicted AAA+ superfamily ATPase
LPRRLSPPRNDSPTPVIDERKTAGLFILTGSQQFEVMTTINQSLAGRTALLKLLPLSMEELAGAGINLPADRLLLDGFYPRIHDAGINPTQIEALKYRLHRGKRNNLYFWRDGKGNEVDLLIETGPDVIPVEIKAGATISGDFFKGLRTFSARLASPPKAAALVYGGLEQQQRSDVAVWRLGDVPLMMHKMESL